MAWVFVASYASTGNKTAGTADTATVSADYGDSLFVVAAADSLNAGDAIPSSGMSDTGGNGYGIIHEQEGAGTDLTDVSVAIFHTRVLHSMSGGTVTFTPNATVAAKAFTVYRFTGGDNQERSTSQGANATGTTVALTHTGPQSGDLVFGAAAMEQPEGSPSVTYDSDTSNGSWSAGIDNGTTGGTSTDNVRVLSQYKIVSATASQTWNLSWTGSFDNSSALIAYSARGPKIFTRADNFPSLDTSAEHWDDNLGSPVVTAGELHLPCVSSSTFVRSTKRVDFLDSKLIAKVTQVPTGGNGTMRSFIRGYINGTNYIEMGVEGSTLYGRQNKSGVVTTHENIGTYNSTTHKWWKIQHDIISNEGYLSYWTSPDGANWTKAGTDHTTTLDPTAVKIQLYCDYTGTESSPVDFVLDNLNAGAGAAPSAAVTSVANQPSTKVSPAASPATITTTANNATVSVGLNGYAESAAVSVAANNANAALGVPAGAATAGTVANDAKTSDVYVNPGVADDVDVPAMPVTAGVGVRAELIG